MAVRAKRRRSKPLQVRVTAEELSLYKKAADAAGLSLSGWIRDRLRVHAAQELPGVARASKDR
jgi:uncharacterized protein (DUF1778 family)